jgi:hypothetical protein
VLVWNLFCYLRSDTICYLTSYCNSDAERPVSVNLCKWTRLFACCTVDVKVISCLLTQTVKFASNCFSLFMSNLQTDTLTCTLSGIKFITVMQNFHAYDHPKCTENAMLLIVSQIIFKLRQLLFNSIACIEVLNLIFSCQCKTHFLMHGLCNCIFFFLGHPSCLDLTSEMIPIIKTYEWQCMECKACVKCMKPHDEVIATLWYTKNGKGFFFLILAD